jgi:hypothetical protein
MSIFVAIVISLIAGAVLDHLFFVDEEHLINQGKEIAYREIVDAKKLASKL